MYNLNVIKNLRKAQRKEEKARFKRTVIFSFYFGILAVITGFYFMFFLGIKKQRDVKLKDIAMLNQQIRSMKRASGQVTRQDIEDLDKLQRNRTFWSKKLVILASMLPEKFWIKEFKFDEKKLLVKGNGYITKDQEQLLVLDDYLARLRKNGVFMERFSSKKVELKYVKMVNILNKDVVEFELEVD